MLKIMKIVKNPKRKAKKVARKRRKKNACRKIKRKSKRKIIRAKKNPPRKYQTIITGLVRTGKKRFKTYYFTGKSFTRNKAEAKIYPGSLGKVEAKRILNLLPDRIASIAVERV